MRPSGTALLDLRALGGQAGRSEIISTTRHNKAKRTHPPAISERVFLNP